MKLSLRRRGKLSGSPKAPTTLFGCYVAASLLGDAERLRMYSPRVKEVYSAGDRNHEVIVEYTFNQLVADFFGNAPGQADRVDRFISDFVKIKSDHMPTRSDLELAIYEKMGLVENSWNFSDRLDELFRIRMAICWGIVSKAPVPSDEVLRLIASAEEYAADSGIELVVAEW